MEKMSDEMPIVGQEMLPVAQGNHRAEKEEVTTIDLGRIFRAIWHYIWVVAIATLLGGAIMFAYTNLFVTDQYVSSAGLYVRNKNTEGNISSTDENVAIVYGHVLKSRDTMKQVCAQYESKYEEIISLGEVSNIVGINVKELGVLEVRCVSSDANKAYRVALCMLEVIENVSAQVFNNMSMATAFSLPELPKAPVDRGVLKNTILGAAVGLVLSCIVIAVMEQLNNNIYTDEYLIETYHIPVLANIPDFKAGQSSSRRRKAYGKYSYYGADAR